MDADTIGLVAFYLFSLICMVGYGVLDIMEQREKDSPDYAEGIMAILAGFTPGNMLVVGMILAVLFFYCIVEGPNWLLKKVLKKKSK